MATRRSTNTDELLDDASIANVIKLLEAEKPITKKAACELLKISYNTTRLNSIIEKFKEKRERERERREALRGKPASQDEIQYIVSEYLEGATIDAISKQTYRGATFIRGVLDRCSVPIRASSHDYFKPSMIPDEAVRNEFAIGEHVYSARYDSMARIEGEIAHKDEKVYRIWLISDRWQQFAYQPASELASLAHLRQLGIKC